MRRTNLLVAVGAFAGLAGLAIYRPSSAQPTKTRQDEAQPARTVQLPIGQVVLFSSGVGYFQREGQVEGDARVDLTFPVQDINDLLKSMVLRDLDGGHISTVSYDSNAPVERTLKSFAINLTGNPSFSAILSQARGEKVEVVMQQGNATQPGTMSGTVIGVEKQKQTSGKEAIIEIDLLNLWCSDGIRSLKMNDVQRIRFLNPIMDSEFKKALETLALSHDTQKKAVSIHFTGDGKRNVRVGYVIENPIWKTSYRLVLDRKEQPFLQGWAIVENPTDEDWKDVRLALVSGRPISFQMDLYQPLYVPRPVIEPELFASLRPPTYSGNLEGEGRGNVEARQPVKKQIEDAMGRQRAGTPELLDAEIAEAKLRLARIQRALSSSPAAVSKDDWRAAEARLKVLLQEKAMALEMGKSVSSVASAARLGDFFQYVIDNPVNLPRQKSAMLPIVTKPVEGTRVSIYNERTQAKFPLLGLKFKNTSGLHLMQGPITVFEGKSYAGDSRILDLQPNEERLLSFAIDLGTEVNPAPSSDNGRITQLKVLKGILHTTTRTRETKTYTIKNRNDTERTVLIEHPVRNDFKLTDTDKPAETASDFYRFQVKVAPGKTETQTVTEERVVAETIQLTNSNDDQLRFFISQTASTPRVKEALKKAIDLRWQVARTQREIAELEKQLKVIIDDQGRLRANLKEMPSTAAAYKRYLEKFDQQETQIEKYQEDIKKQQGIEHNQQKAFEEYLNTLNAE
jgi:hypothetical protein